MILGFRSFIHNKVLKVKPVCKDCLPKPLFFKGGKRGQAIESKQH